MNTSLRLGDLFEEALQLDRDDPLSGFRSEFCIPRDKAGAELSYLCGNSLGLAPRQAAQYVNAELRAWEELGVEGHFKAQDPWVSFHELFTMPLTKIVGALPQEVVAMNTLTVNLHLMLFSFYRPTIGRSKVLVAHTPFPSDRYAIASQVALRGFDPEEEIMCMTPDNDQNVLSTEEIIATIQDRHDEIQLIIMDGVNYYTGELLDICEITKVAHRYDITVGFDLAHAVGNVPLKLHEWEVDFAVWCSYKYLNGGPGCVAGAFIHEKHGLAEQPIPRCAGWWGHDKAIRFQMGAEFVAIPGVEGWQLSNPPLFSLAALRASFDLFDQVGMERLCIKSVTLTGFLERTLGAYCADLIELVTPCDSTKRGCQLSVRVKRNAQEVFSALGQHGVVCDWREPDVIRLTPVPFYNSFGDVARCVEVIARMLEGGHKK